jgi:gliding motility-associated-like protein
MRVLFLIIGLLAFHSLAAQTLHRHVIGSAGRTNTVNGRTVHWTIGETAVLSLAQGNTRLTQGFQQGNIGCDVYLGNDTLLCSPSLILNAGMAETYLWSTGATSPTIDVTQNGGYSVTITTAQGCSASDTINVDLTAALATAATLDVQNVACAGQESGQITVHANSGNGSLTYSVNGIDYQNDSVFTDLPSADYFVFIQNSEGCEDTLTATVLSPPPLELVLNQVFIDCPNGSGNQVLASVTGGVQPYDYSWDNGAIVDDSLSTSLAAGNVSIVITDQNGCSVTGQLMVQNHPEASSTVAEQACESQIVIIENDTFSVDNPSGTIVLVGEGANGCDSIINVMLDFSDIIEVDYNQDACIGDTVVVEGELFSADTPTGTILLSGQTAEDCDTLLSISVEFQPLHELILTDVICEGESYPFGGMELTESGIYWDTLTNSDGGCDTILQLELDAEPLLDIALQPDEFAIHTEDEITSLPVLENDEIGTSDFQLILASPTIQSGELAVVDDYIEFYLTNNGFIGSDSFLYTVCHTICSDHCDSTYVYLNIDENCISEIIEGGAIPRAFSPNNDGVNDVFDPLKEFVDRQCPVVNGDIELMIYNRWGEVVFKPETYQLWDGLRPNGNAKPMPKATYYYILKILKPDGSEEIVKGAISIWNP